MSVWVHLSFCQDFLNDCKTFSLWQVDTTKSEARAKWPELCVKRAVCPVPPWMSRLITEYMCEWNIASIAPRVSWVGASEEISSIFICYAGRQKKLVGHIFGFVRNYLLSRNGNSQSTNNPSGYLLFVIGYADQWKRKSLRVIGTIPLYSLTMKKNQMEPVLVTTVWSPPTTKIETNQDRRLPWIEPNALQLSQKRICV